MPTDFSSMNSSTIFTEHVDYVEVDESNSDCIINVNKTIIHVKAKFMLSKFLDWLVSIRIDRIKRYSEFFIFAAISKQYFDKKK